MFNVSPITKALQEIHFRIPNEILVDTFINTSLGAQTTGESIDGIILSTVIRPRVMVDCNILGGRELKIELASCESQVLEDGYSVIYRVPKQLTNGRSIISALSIVPYNDAYGSSCGSTPPMLGSPTEGNLVGMAERAMMSTSQPYMGFNANLDLIGENTVLAKYYQQVTVNGTMRVRVENEVNMNNLQPAAYHTFADLAVLATKSYIYNKMYVLRNRAELVGGQTLDSIRNYLDTLSDSEELYQETLRTKWVITAMANDDERMTHYLNLIMPNGV